VTVRPGPDRVNILMVDDMENNLVALEAVLRPLGQNLVRARSGEEALKALLRREFAVVLLDVCMPGMDGFETASMIKRMELTRDVPVIFLTGNDPTPGYAFRGYASGAVDFMAKPFDPWVLKAKVGVFVELHQKSRLLQEQALQLVRLLDDESSATYRNGQLLAGVSERLRVVEERLGRAPGTGDVSLAECVARLQDAVEVLRSAYQPVRETVEDTVGNTVAVL
jgi:CheY-like chemotaxis protein